MVNQWQFLFQRKKHEKKYLLYLVIFSLLNSLELVK